MCSLKYLTFARYFSGAMVKDLNIAANGSGFWLSELKLMLIVSHKS